MNSAQKKILVAVDGSEYSLNAVKYAGEILKGHNTQVILLHVLWVVDEAFWGIKKKPFPLTRLDPAKANGLRRSLRHPPAGGRPGPAPTRGGSKTGNSQGLPFPGIPSPSEVFFCKGRFSVIENERPGGKPTPCARPCTGGNAAPGAKRRGEHGKQVGRSLCAPGETGTLACPVRLQAGRNRPGYQECEPDRVWHLRELRKTNRSGTVGNLPRSYVVR